MADRGKARAGGDGRHGKTAAIMAEPAMGGVIEIVRQRRVVDEAAGEDEERQHRELEIEREAEHLLAGHGKGRAEPRRMNDGEAEKADREQHDAQRHAGKEAEQHHDEAGERRGHSGPASPSAAASPALPLRSRRYSNSPAISAAISVRTAKA